MKKALFIIKNKNEASSRFRVIAYFKKLENDFSIDVFYSEYHNKKIPKPLRSSIKRFRFLTLLWRIKSYNIIYMQRPMSSDKSASIFFEKLLAIRNQNIIFDFDDALFIQNNKKITKLISMSKACVCGNNYLHDFSIKYNSNVHIIPTAIDTKKFSPKEEKTHSALTIGWTGTSGNYQFFTKKMINQINHFLTKNHDIIFLFICDHKPDERFNFPYNFIKWNEETEVTDLKKIDIGLMPLKDSAWSKGKCGFKLIQYGAIGIPSIASDVGVNNDVIIDKKTGFIVTDDNWFTPLETLINAPELCRKMGEGAAQHICNNYSLDANYEKLLRVINSVIDE